MKVLVLKSKYQFLSNIEMFLFSLELKYPIAVRLEFEDNDDVYCYRSCRINDSFLLETA